MRDNNKEVKTIKIGLRGYKKTLKKVKKLKREMKQLNKAAKEFTELKENYSDSIDMNILQLGHITDWPMSSAEIEKE